MKTCALILSLFLANQMVFAEPNMVIYKNSFGSTLTLNFGQENTLTGSFTSAIASKECQDVIGIARPIIGYVNGSAITFSINYPSCGSVVTLAGHINTDKDTIDTIAIITHQASNVSGGIGTQFITHNTFIKDTEG